MLLPASQDVDAALTECERMAGHATAQKKKRYK